MVERAVQITTQDFRVPAGLRTRERQAEPVARGASLVALGGEVSWHWQDYFRVAAATQAAVHKFEVPLCWGGCGNLLLAIASPEDSVADYVAACRHDQLYQDRAGVAAIVAAICATCAALTRQNPAAHGPQ